MIPAARAAPESTLLSSPGEGTRTALPLPRTRAIIHSHPYTHYVRGLLLPPPPHTPLPQALQNGCSGAQNSPMASTWLFPEHSLHALRPAALSSVAVYDFTPGTSQDQEAGCVLHCCSPPPPLSTCRPGCCSLSLGPRGTPSHITP